MKKKDEKDAKDKKKTTSQSDESLDETSVSDDSDANLGSPDSSDSQTGDRPPSLASENPDTTDDTNGNPETKGSFEIPTLNRVDKVSSAVTPELMSLEYNPPNGIETVPYSYAPTLPGVTAAAVTTGTLPGGLTLNPTTGALTGTPTVDGNFDFSITFTVGGSPEVVAVDMDVFPFMTVTHYEDGASQGAVADGDDVDINPNKNNQLVASGGSGNYQYTISGDNVISSSGVMQLFESGEVTVTVTDTTSNQTVNLTLLVAAQTDICGLAVEEDSEAQTDSGPCTDILTDCETPVTVAFNALTLLRGIEAGAVAYREALNFTQMEGATISNNQRYFAMFRSTAGNGFAVAENAKDGRPFLIEFAVDASVKGGSGDVVIGIARSYEGQGFSGLDYALAISGASASRKVELRKQNVLVAGSQFTVLEGQQVGLAVYDDTVILYVDGLVKFTVTGNTFACSGVDIVFAAADEGMIIGGRASNLMFDIETLGDVDEVGTIDPQTGLYTPAKNNIGLVRIKAVNNTNANAVYHAKVRVLKPAVKSSLEKAMIEGAPVDMWVCGPTRFDDLPLRLDRQGRPDRNQVDDPRHLGTLAGSGRIETQVTRNEFRNDRGATSTSLTFDKVIITGAYLNVRDVATVKRLVPFMKELNRGGVRSLRQYSSGCQHKLRILLVWETPDCEDVTVYDAIEIFNGLSYTPYVLEVGKAVQSQLALTIEGFPMPDGSLFDYNQYDKHFHRIGA